MKRHDFKNKYSHINCEVKRSDDFFTITIEPDNYKLCSINAVINNMLYIFTHVLILVSICNQSVSIKCNDLRIQCQSKQKADNTTALVSAFVLPLFVQTLCSLLMSILLDCHLRRRGVISQIEEYHIVMCSERQLILLSALGQIILKNVQGEGVSYCHV